MKIVDLAKAIDSKCKQEIVGIRPGEKVHETLLSEDEACISANKASSETWQEYEKAFNESKMGRKAFDDGPGKELHDKWQNLYDVRKGAEKAFNEGSGKELHDKWRNLYGISDKAEKALKQARANSGS